MAAERLHGMSLFRLITGKQCIPNVRPLQRLPNGKSDGILYCSHLKRRIAKWPRYHVGDVADCSKAVYNSITLWKGGSRHGSDRIHLDESGYPGVEFTCRRNEFDEPEFFEGAWLVDYRPIGYRALPRSWNIGRPPNIVNISSSSWRSMAVMTWRGFFKLPMPYP